MQPHTEYFILGYFNLNITETAKEDELIFWTRRNNTKQNSRLMKLYNENLLLFMLLSVEFFLNKYSNRQGWCKLYNLDKFFRKIEKYKIFCT